MIKFKSKLAVMAAMLLLACSPPSKQAEKIKEDLSETGTKGVAEPGGEQAGPEGWMTAEKTDELTGTVSQQTYRSVELNDGTAELFATCSPAPLFDNDPTAVAAGHGTSVVFRLSVFGRDDEHGLEIGPRYANATARLRLFGLDGAGVTDMYISLSHINSATFALAARSYSPDARPDVLRLEIPLLAHVGSSDDAPVSSTEVIDLLPRDEILSQLFDTCVPAARAAPAEVSPTTSLASPN